MFGLLPLSLLWLPGARGAGWTELQLLALGSGLFLFDLVACSVAVAVDRERPSVLREAPLQRLVFPFLAWWVFLSVGWRVVTRSEVRWRAGRRRVDPTLG